MADINPYAAPQQDVVVEALLAEPGGGVWREGKILVMHKQAVLPDRCVKCNQPAGGRRLKRKLYWHHPAWFLLILISLWIYIIAALIVRHSAKIEIGLCEIHRRKRWQAIAISWLFVLAGILGMVVGAIMSDAPVNAPQWPGPVLILAGTLLLLAGALWGAIVVPPVTPQKIDADYVWLKRIGPEFLAPFPPISG